MHKKTTITIEQISSPIRRSYIQRLNLIGLGLNKMHRKKTLKNSPSIQGMIKKVKHLIRVTNCEISLKNEK